MKLHPKQIAGTTRLFFDYGLSFNGPVSYGAQSEIPARLSSRAALLIAEGVRTLIAVLDQHFHLWPVPFFPLREAILEHDEPTVPTLFSSRFDVVIDEQGNGHLIEMNADRNGMQRESMADPVQGDAFRRLYLQALRARWESSGGAGRIPYAAVMIAPAYREESSLAPFLAVTVTEGLGWPCIIAGVENITVNQHGEVFAFGQRIDLIIRQYPAEYLYELDCGAELIQAHQQGKLLIVNDPKAIRLQAKNWMATLTQWLRDERSPLTAEQRRILGPLLPYTATLAEATLPVDPLEPESPQIPLRQALSLHPERWVLKPALGRYSWGVTCGALAAADEWREAVRFAFARPDYWIVQAYLAPQPAELHRWQDGQIRTVTGYINYGVHVLDGRIAGWAARCSLSQVTDDAWFARVELTD